MSSSMRCEELREMYELYALGVLEQEERTAIDEHLERKCEVCTPGVKRAAAVNAAILSFVPDVEPSRGLRTRVIASVGGGSKAFSWWPVWAVATAGLAVAAMTFYFEQRDSNTQLAQAKQTLSDRTIEANKASQILEFLNQPETKAVGFRGTEPAPPRGNFFVNPRSGVLMIASNLPKLDAGKTYEMWLIPKGKNPVPAGLFRLDERGGAVHLQAGPIDVAAMAAVAVSLEPESGSAQPTTKPIIVAPVLGP
jgi:anti-sigma-K factor RskA